MWVVAAATGTVVVQEAEAAVEEELPAEKVPTLSVAAHVCAPWATMKNRLALLLPEEKRES